MKPGDTILILPSLALNKMQIGQLAGITATVIEIVKKNNKIIGCWVQLPTRFMGESEWFIPYNSFVL